MEKRDKMEALANLITTNPVVFWLIVAIAAGVLEAVTVCLLYTSIFADIQELRHGGQAASAYDALHVRCV